MKSSRVNISDRGDSGAVHEMLLNHIEMAINSEGEEKQLYLKKGMENIGQLVDRLKFEIPLSKDLFKVYVYVHSVLMKNRDDEKLKKAYQLISKIYKE